MPSARSLYNELVFEVGLNEQDISDTTVNGATWDRLGPSNDNALDEFIALVDIGTRTTDGTYTIHLEDSPDASVWTDVDAALVLLGSGSGSAAAGESAGTVVVDGAADDDQQIVFGYLGI